MSVVEMLEFLTFRYIFTSLQVKLFLARAAPPGSPLRDHGPHDRIAAPAAVLSRSPVYRKHVLKAAFQPSRIDVIVDAASAHADGTAQNLDECSMQSANGRARQPLRGRRCSPRPRCAADQGEKP